MISHRGENWGNVAVDHHQIGVIPDGGARGCRLVPSFWGTGTVDHGQIARNPLFLLLFLLGAMVMLPAGGMRPVRLP